MLESKCALKILAIEEDGDKVLDQKLITIILDEKDFWEWVYIMTKIFQSIVKWIILLESDDPKISEVPEAFKNIKGERPVWACLHMFCLVWCENTKSCVSNAKHIFCSKTLLPPVTF